MEIPNLKNWKSALLLSIIIPLGLLTAFKLSGLVREPQVTVETETLQPVRWETERPTRTMKITENDANEDVTASYYCSEFSMNSTITIYGYHIQSWYGGSYLEIAISATASAPIGCVSAVNATFQESYVESEVYLSSSSDLQSYENLSITKSVGGSQLSGVQKAFFTLTGSNSPKQVGFRRCADWVLRSLYNQTHLLEVDAQFTYFSGTIYKTVVQPFLLKIWPDDNNSFETAEELSVNQTRRAFIEYNCSYPGYICYDTVDYYKIWLDSGATANFKLNYLDKAGIEMRVYNPNQQLEGSLICTVNETLCQLTVNIDQTGWWYIKTDAGSAEFIYTITVTTQGDNQ